MRAGAGKAFLRGADRRRQHAASPSRPRAAQPLPVVLCHPQAWGEDWGSSKKCFIGTDLFIALAH